MCEGSGCRVTSRGKIARMTKIKLSMTYKACGNRDKSCEAGERVAKTGIHG